MQLVRNGRMIAVVPARGSWQLVPMLTEWRVAVTMCAGVFSWGGPMLCSEPEPQPETASFLPPEGR